MRLLVRVLLDFAPRVILFQIFNLLRVMEVLFILGLVVDMQDVVPRMFHRALPSQVRIATAEMV